MPTNRLLGKSLLNIRYTPIWLINVEELNNPNPIIFSIPFKSQDCRFDNAWEGFF